MPKPKLEPGFTPIPNDLFEAIMVFDFTIGQRKIVDAVVRQTYGWNRREAAISREQFSKLTGIKNPDYISRIVGQLVAMKVLRTKQQTPKPTLFHLYPYPSKWQPYYTGSAVYTTPVVQYILHQQCSIGECESLVPKDTLLKKELKKPPTPTFSKENWELIQEAHGVIGTGFQTVGEILQQYVEGHGRAGLTA